MVQPNGLTPQRTLAEQLRRRRDNEPSKDDVMIRIPRSLWRDVQARARLTNRTASAELRVALDFWIEHPMEETIVSDERI